MANEKYRFLSEVKKHRAQIFQIIFKGRNEMIVSHLLAYLLYQIAGSI